MKMYRSILTPMIRFCMENKLVMGLLLTVLVGWGIMVAPFNWEIPGVERSPVPVDAIPDIGENQQIVFTEWMGRSPQDVEDQITYPLTTALLGIPNVKTIRSFSMFGFSSIYIIFEEDAEFYWTRSRILEKLNSLPSGTLPPNVQPTLGPDATALGQVFWYTLEGRNENGDPVGGWDLDELRSIQDWYVRFGLQSVPGVAEVASIGGHVREYQIDVDPAAMRQHNVKIGDIYNSVRQSNVDVGARTIEVNRVEYVVRGLGFIKTQEDIERTVVKYVKDVPITIGDVAEVSVGPALRRGVLDKEGAEAVGGVVVSRYGENPLKTINSVKEKIKEISPGLPVKTLADGTVSKITIVPFYDRTGLIYETLGTLNHALRDEILITVIVVLLMVMHLRASVLISLLLPLTVLFVFIGMKIFGVDANIVALSGIAIAIGTIVDMGIIVSENMLKRLDEADQEEQAGNGKINRLEVLLSATSEVGSAVLTAVATTVVSFLPVFAMEAAEGKLFRPLAYTKTFALISSVIIALTILPPLAHVLFSFKVRKNIFKKIWQGTVAVAGLLILFWLKNFSGLFITALGLLNLFNDRIPIRTSSWKQLNNGLVVLGIISVLASTWMPLSAGSSFYSNFLFTLAVIVIIMSTLFIFTRYYGSILRWSLNNRRKMMAVPTALVLFAILVWTGFNSLFGFLPEGVKQTRVYQSLNHGFPGLGKEFMPPLDEGSFLYMPTTMPHAGMEESIDVLQTLDMALNTVPEVEMVVGKIGRAESPLDPAPLSMVETVINYKPEFKTDLDGNIERFKVDREGDYLFDLRGDLIPDRNGKPFRNWRDHIQSPDDIWNEIIRAANIPGTTSAPKLQPIAARLVMLQSGMRAPMGIKVKGPDLETIEKFGLEIEKHLKMVPTIKTSAVFADRIVGKPYLEIDINREKISRYGISIQSVQSVIEVAIGGRQITTTFEGRERYPVRIRYQRELRDNIESLADILVPTPSGAQIPISQLANINFVRGPQVIKSEDTFLVGYVLFDKNDGLSEIDVVENAARYLENLIESGDLIVPEGVNYTFAGSYENQVRATKKLRVILPLSLLVIFVILYLQFKKVSTSLIVFSGIFVAWAGGFILIWLYGQPWFMNFSIFGIGIRELFQIGTVNLSVAVWVGFLALFGIATDDGVIISTYLDQSFADKKPATIEEIREATIDAGLRRIRPAMMTAGTTLLALIPVLTSTGKGADVMVPMAIPTFGGMIFVIITTFVVPVLYSYVQERKLFNN